MSFPIEYLPEQTQEWIFLLHKKIEISSKHYILIFTAHKNENKSQIILLSYLPFKIEKEKEKEKEIEKEKEKEKEKEEEKKSTTEKKTYSCDVETKMTKKKVDSVFKQIENNTSAFEYSEDDDHFVLSLGLQDFILEKKTLPYVDQYYETLVVEEKYKEYENKIEQLTNEKKQMQIDFQKRTKELQETIEELTNKNKKLLIELGDLKEKEEKENVTVNFLEESKILLKEKENHQKYRTKLQKWLGEAGFNANLKLRYSTRKHGWSNRVFHKKCDRKGRSLTLIKLKNGSLFGGYAEGEWWSPQGSGKFHNSTNQKSFIFSLRSKNSNRKSFIFKRRISNNTFEMTSNKNYGPIWGGGKGYDLLLNLEAQDNCFSSLGACYWSDSAKLTKKNHSSFLAGTDDDWEFGSIEIFCEK
ncbi:pep-cterm sorting domain-containing protein [Anaeramoeba flamelloides]|uniref:Pep-cterm sorting domain-containing protein n=1 Tax=Anaeramoeba flamelloides TaxID=1746091 RepID=A0AAV8A399_9EUKA|nr:pep-cterm sorting domain-containing protein [Anaeramoeba flamelloides]